MRESLAVINTLLVEIFNDILTIEESALKAGQFTDISVTEIHTIEKIGMYEPKSMGEVAKALGVTVGTLTVAVNNLVKKGYVERFRIPTDRRIVQIGLTKKGRLIYRLHEKFHIDMVESSIDGLSKEEEIILREALEKLHSFLYQKYLAGEEENQ